jgi:hypothetical protein
MSLSERKSTSSKDCGSEASTSISTFVIKIFNLLNVSPSLTLRILKTHRQFAGTQTAQAF